MKRPAQHPVSLVTSVRARLTLWYLAVMTFIMVLFGGSLYASQTFLNADAAESRLETQLYQDSQRFAETYKRALLDRQVPTALHLNPSSQEMVLLLRPDGSVLDARGPLTGSVIQQLRARAEQNAGMIDLAIPQNHPHGWWARDTTYRVLMTPVLTQLEQPEEYRHVLEQVQTENEQMTAIVNSLLLLARADTGQLMLDLQEVDLSDIALASVERLLPLARRSQVTLATGDLPEMLVCGDPHYLGQVLTNLIENGIKYSSGIGKRVYVELACEQKRWGVVRVQDDGPGISEEHLPYLFERFYRVDKARSPRQKGPVQDSKP